MSLYRLKHHNAFQKSLYIVAFHIPHPIYIMAVATSGFYAKASSVDFDKDWYHGELTRVQAKKVLRESKTPTAS